MYICVALTGLHVSPTNTHVHICVALTGLHVSPILSCIFCLLVSLFKHSIRDPQ